MEIFIIVSSIMEEFLSLQWELRIHQTLPDQLNNHRVKNRLICHLLWQNQLWIQIYPKYKVTIEIAILKSNQDIIIWGQINTRNAWMALWIHSSNNNLTHSKQRWENLQIRPPNPLSITPFWPNLHLGRPLADMGREIQCQELEWSIKLTLPLWLQIRMRKLMMKYYWHQHLKKFIKRKSIRFKIQIKIHKMW